MLALCRVINKASEILSFTKREEQYPRNSVYFSHLCNIWDGHPNTNQFQEPT